MILSIFGGLIGACVGIGIVGLLLIVSAHPVFFPVFSWLFPPSCSICGRETKKGREICKSCWKKGWRIAPEGHWMDPYGCGL